MFKKTFLKSLLLAMSVGALSIGCSSSSDSPAASSGGSTSSPLVISGSLDTSALSAKLQKASLLSGGNNPFQAVSASDLELYGLAFSDPPEASTVDVGADGSFSLSFSADAAGSQISLIFRYKTGTENAGQEVGVVKFEDTSDVDMQGNAKKSSSISLDGSVSLGNIAVNASGEVVVPVSQVAAVRSDAIDASAGFDFEGVWTFAEFDGTLPAGYEAPCAQNDMNCKGPPIGMSIWVDRLEGKKFTPDAACQSAVDGDTFDGSATTCGGSTDATVDKYGIQVWMSKAAHDACDGTANDQQYPLGVDYDDAKGYARIDLTNDPGTSSENFAWTTSHDFGGSFGLETISEGWKSNKAVSDYGVEDCAQVPVIDLNNKTLMGWKCTDGAGNYRIHVFGGCFDANNNPIHFNNWNASPDSFDPPAASSLISNYFETVDTYNSVDPDDNSGNGGSNGPLAAQQVTCKHHQAEYDSGNSQVSLGTFNQGTVAQILAQGAACSSVAAGTDVEKLASLRCYLDHYYQNMSEQSDAVCLKRVEGDWSTSDPTQFIIEGNGPDRADNLFVFSLFQYDSATSGFFEDNEVYSRGLSAGSGWVDCKVENTFKMSFKQRNATTLVAEFIDNYRLIDIDKPACVKDCNSENSEVCGSSKSMMLLTK